MTARTTYDPDHNPLYEPGTDDTVAALRRILADASAAMERHKKICDARLANNLRAAQADVKDPVRNTAGHDVITLQEAYTRDDIDFARSSSSYKFNQARVNTISRLLQLAATERLRREQARTNELLAELLTELIATVRAR